MHVDRRFPDRGPAIRALAETDPAFRAMLAEYEEICTWLAAHTRPAPPDNAELANVRIVVRELEEEILSELERHNGSAG